MPVELVVEAFAVVVIGGLGSMRGALVGALIVGLTRAAAISLYAELEVLAIYVIVIAVLVAPAGRACSESRWNERQHERRPGSQLAARLRRGDDRRARRLPARRRAVPT
jgi:hypothetical protein